MELGVSGIRMDSFRSFPLRLNIYTTENGFGIRWENGLRRIFFDFSRILSTDALKNPCQSARSAQSVLPSYHPFSTENGYIQTLLKSYLLIINTLETGVLKTD
jgi:hypothetical protein